MRTLNEIRIHAAAFAKDFSAAYAGCGWWVPA